MNVPPGIHTMFSNGGLPASDCGSLAKIMVVLSLIPSSFRCLSNLRARLNLESLSPVKTPSSQRKPLSPAILFTALPHLIGSGLFGYLHQVRGALVAQLHNVFLGRPACKHVAGGSSV